MKPRDTVTFDNGMMVQTLEGDHSSGFAVGLNGFELSPATARRIASALKSAADDADLFESRRLQRRRRGDLTREEAIYEARKYRRIQEVRKKHRRRYYYPPVPPDNGEDR